MAAAVAYSGAPGSRAENARAAANDDDACALGKLSAVGVAISAGRSSSVGRARRKTPLIAVFSTYVAATAIVARRQRGRRRASTAIPAAPTTIQHAACSPHRENRLTTPSAGGRADERTARYRCRSARAIALPIGPPRSSARRERRAPGSAAEYEA